MVENYSGIEGTEHLRVKSIEDRFQEAGLHLDFAIVKSILAVGLSEILILRDIIDSIYCP